MSKTLFVCQANVGRSQVAMELFKKKGGSADSSGTLVDAPGTTLTERPSSATIVGIMRKDYGIDMINNVRTQITEENAKEYDRLVVMAEEETWPEWLRSDPRVIHWKIQDPKFQNEATTQAIVDQVAAKIDTLPLE